MCKLPDGVANSDVGDLKKRIEENINPALQYACRSWHTHLLDKDKIPVYVLDITSTLRRFLETKFLLWLEVLSVLGAVRNAVDALQKATDWLKVGSMRLRLRLASCMKLMRVEFSNHLTSTSPMTAPVL